ncbi:MAG: DUF1559 domain-containing protein [Planctomycetaceae bacterium]
MRVPAICLLVACALNSGAPLLGSEPVGRPVRPTAKAPQATKPFDLSYVHSRFVAGFVAKPRQVLQSPFGRTAIATAFRGTEFDETMTLFTEQFGMDLADIEQFAILFSERNIAAMNGIDLPQSGRRPGQTSRAIRTNLMQLALAAHNFHDVYQRFPGFIPPGKGKLSWRVHILPYMEEFELYQKFDMDEDWDSDTNKPLIAEMPDCFKTPGVDEDGKTAFHISDLTFPVGQKIQFRDITDGSSNTIMHIRGGADTAVEWTKPGRLEIGETDPWDAVGAVDDSFWVSMADGSVRKVNRKETDDDQLKAMLTYNGGEVVGLAGDIRRSRNPDRNPTLIVQSAKPINQTHVLNMAADTFGEATKKRGNGNDYFDHEGYAVWFPDDKSVVATPTSMLPGIMSKRKTTSVLRGTMSANKDADLIGVFDIKGMPAIYAAATADFPPEIPACFKDVNHLTGVMNLSSADRPILKTGMHFKNGKSARSVGAMANGVLAYISEVDVNRMLLIDDEFSGMTQAVLKTLAATDIERNGSVLQHTVARPPSLVEDLKPSFRMAGALFRQQRERTRQYKLMGKMKEIGVAFHNHHDVYRSFGAADGSTTDGRKAGLSWRVHLLPFVEEGQLYQQFKLNEPWDSDHNKKLIAKMPDVFKSKGVTEAGKTSVHVLLGNNAPFKDGKTSFGIDDCIDGTSMTILAVVAGADKAEIWTKPGGLQVDTEDPVGSLGKVGERFQVLLGDGSVHFIQTTIDSAVLNALMTNAGRELIDNDSFRN